MVNTIFILDKTYNTTQILVGDKSSQRMFWDDLYTQEFDTGAETFEFSCYLDENVVEGNYVAFYYNNQYKLFTIMDMEQTHKKGRLVANCYCEIASLSLLNNYVREFSGDMNCIQFFEHILNGTDWQIGRYSTSLRNRVETIKVSKIESVWSLIEDYKDIFECEINVRVTYENGHVTGQYIDIYSDGGLGSSTLKRFEYGRNVTGITKKKELYDWCTGIILDVDCDVSDTVIEERDGYGFTKGAGDIILNDNANRMYNAGRNYVIGVYEGKETEPVEACINAWKELEKRSVPRFDYEVTTALTEDEYEEVHLGDTVYVVDRSYTPPLFLEARVGKLELSFTDRTQNKCVLTNYKEIKSKLLDADYIKLTGTITDVVNAFFPITSEGIADGAIVDGKIETTYFQQITADIVSAGIGAFENLYAQGMTVINADIENLRATSADITDLKAQVAEIDTLINGHLTSDNIQSLILTADKVTVEDAFIKDAMIDSVTANKITSGSINTNNVYISSEDGSMIINGNLQQFKDKDGNVRIQIGKDAQGDFTFSLFDEFGTGVLIDEKGITENAIADGLIVNDMVAENANIAGSKLDIDSVVTEINEGTTTIKGTKVVLDENNQTLDMAFSSLNSKVENLVGVEDTNLLKNTAFKDGLEYWEPGNIQATIIDDNSDSPLPWMTAKRLRMKCNARFGDVIQKVDLVPGATYTVSFWIKGHVGGRIVLAVLCYDDNGISYERGREVVAMTGEYQKLETTFTAHSTRTNHGVRFAITYDGTDYTGVCEAYMGMAKLEEGSVATDWVAPSMGLVEMVEANTTAIRVQQGEISNLISNTTITKENGEVVQLKDEYNSTKDTVDSHTTKIGSLETTVNTVSSKQASMELDLDGFRTEVSSSYATKGELESLKSSANFIKNGKFEGAVENSYDMPAEWKGWGCEKRIYSTPYLEDGVVRIEIREEGEDGGIYQDVYGLPKNTTFTLSFKYHVEQNVQNPYCDITFYDNNDNRVSDDLVYDLDVAGAGDDTAKWKVITFTTPNVDFRNIIIGFGTLGGLLVNNGNYVNFSIGLVQLELGSTQTPWKAHESIYVTKTEFQQSNEDFTFKIQESGGYNLLKNSAFTNGTEYWTKLCWDGTHTASNNLHVMEAYRTWNNNHFAGLEYLATVSQPQGFIRGGFDSSYVYNLEPGAKYSFSCYASCGRVDELIIELCGTDWNSQYQNWGILWRGAVGANTREGKNYEGWTKIEFTFTAPDAYCIWLRFWGNNHTEGDLATSLMISQPCLVRGSIPLDWSPHPSEIYDGVVKIDSRGLTVQHGTNSTVMDSNSFQIKVGSETHAQIKNGQFRFTDASGSNMLGRVGRSYWEGTGIAMTSLGASYGNTIALSAQHESGGTYITGAVCSSKEQWIGDSYYFQGLDISAPVVTGRMRFRTDYENRMYSQDGMSVGMMDLWAINDSSWGGYGGMVIGNNNLRIGTYSGVTAKAGFLIREDNTQSNGTAIHGYAPIDMHGYSITNSSSTMSLNAQSEYARSLLSTGTNEQISYSGLNYNSDEIRWCWKEPVFTYQDCDIDPVTDKWVYFDRYVCYVELPIFMAENIEVDYHINVSKMSWGDWRIREKNQYYFILESQEEDFAFTFEVVAKLKDGATITNNAIIANNSIDTEASISVPQDIEGVVDPVGSINLQENINIGEE